MRQLYIICNVVGYMLGALAIIIMLVGLCTGNRDSAFYVIYSMIAFVFMVVGISGRVATMNFGRRYIDGIIPLDPAPEEPACAFRESRKDIQHNIAPSTMIHKETTSKLVELRQLYDAKLIDDDEYKKLKSKVLESLGPG